MKADEFHKNLFLTVLDVIFIFCVFVVAVHSDILLGEPLNKEKSANIRKQVERPVQTMPAAEVVTLMPEIAQSVELSSSDVNRITCSAEIKDVIFSKEKGITVKFKGRDAFVKFLTTRKEGQTVYSTVPSELFIVCGDNVYSLIAIPRRIPARSIRLSSGKAENIAKNKSMLGALPFEKKILSTTKSLYVDDIPESFTVTTVNRQIDTFKELDLVLSRIVAINGEGITVKEYRASPIDGKESIEISEKDFLRKEISLKPLAVSIDRLVLKKGDTARIFIVEPNQEESGNER